MVRPPLLLLVTTLTACSGSKGGDGGSGDDTDSADGSDGSADGTDGADGTADCDEDGDGHCPEDGDCDDDDPAVHPGATEVCDDHIDNNCNGSSDGCVRLEHADPSIIADASIQGTVDQEVIGALDLRFVGDLDADGKDDLAIGSAFNADEVSSLRLFQRGVEGTVTSEDADLTFVGPPNDCFGYFGWSVAGGVDWTGDGSSDLVVGAPQTCQVADLEFEGAVYLFAGADPDDRVTTILGVGPNDAIGQRLAYGDADGDGQVDLFIGGADDLGTWIFNGPLPTGGLSVAEANVPLDGLPYPTAFGVGDFDGDGQDDLASGLGGAGGFTGELRVALGPIAGSVGFDDLPNATLTITGANAELGAVLRVGELNGDGYDDIAVSAPGADSYGAVYLVYGPPTSGDVAAVAAAALRGDGYGSRTGSSVALGDFDGDDHTDVLVGAPYDSLACSGCGKGALFYGPSYSSLTLASADFVINGGAPDQGMGFQADFGDADGDGIADLAIGAPYEAGGGTRRGAVYLALGRGL